VVPLVDVVLVLLIIFMVTAQVMEFGLQIDVAKVKERQTTTEDLPVISITKSAQVYLNGKPLNINEIGTSVKQRFPKAEAVYVQADKNLVVNYLMQVVSAVGEQKLQVKLVTKSEDIPDKRR
jgi:biopolymer transport protein ExbD